MKRYLITGATGYIGSMLVKHIREMDREAQITALVRDRKKAKAMLPGDVSVITADLTDRAEVKTLEVSCDYLIHCASFTRSAEMVSHPVEVTESIVNATQNVLELARRCVVQSMVYLSSMEVYGALDCEADHRTAEKEAAQGMVELLDARSCYPLGKRMAENLCYSYYKEYGIPVKIARLAQTFGRGILSEENRVFAQFVRAAREGRDIVLHTKGESMGNYCGIRDAIEGILVILEKGENGQAYNVVNEKNTMTIKEMAELVAEKIARKKIHVIYDIPEDNLYGYARGTGLRLSGKKLMELGWTPAQGMEEMYQEMMDSLEKTIKKVILQRFPMKAGGRLFPYPPLYREPDTDYICFTDDERVRSSAWEIRVVENPMQADLEPYLKEYAVRRELQPEQIQMGELLSAACPDENVITVPALEELPLVQFDPARLVPTADEKGGYLYRRNPVYRDGKYNGRPLLLTIGVPVSNQIGTIDRCLSHIKPLLDQLDAELLVIDTGSTDGTVEVCKRYGARVIVHPWCDNMSLVRNEGIYHAKGEWYMSIDDDEWFEDVEEILRFFKSNAYRNYDKASYIQRNYMDMAGTVYEDHHTLRMARITPELHFEGRIHDSLTMELSNNKACLLHSCAHHYGFVRDSEDKKMNKFARNASILLQDVYEYPCNLRYLFQLANEYRCIDRNDVAIKLFAEVVAMAKEMDDKLPGKSSVVMLAACLYDVCDRRLFQWGNQLAPMFPLTTSEQAFIAWCQEGMAFQYKQPPGQVLEYYRNYEESFMAYQKDPVAGQYLNFYGLATVEQDLYIMNARAMAFCSYLEIGEEGKALELLLQISLDVIVDRRFPVLRQGLAAGDNVYHAVCNKLTLIQWEEWADEILEAFVAGLAKDSVYIQQLERLPYLLQRLGVTAIISWFGHSRERSGSKVEARLYEYARSHELEDTSVQELCFCAWVLKDAYVRNREAENSQEILYHYLFATALFAERYYNKQLLNDVQCRAIPPDIRAACCMAMVLADGKASHENVIRLKQALAIFPAFHEEIRGILTDLSKSGG